MPVTLVDRLNHVLQAEPREHAAAEDLSPEDLRLVVGVFVLHEDAEDVAGGGRRVAELAPCHDAAQFEARHERRRGHGDVEAER